MCAFYILSRHSHSAHNGRDPDTVEALISKFVQWSNFNSVSCNFKYYILYKGFKFEGSITHIVIRTFQPCGIKIYTPYTIPLHFVPKMIQIPCRTGRLCNFVAIPIYKHHAALYFIAMLCQHTCQLEHCRVTSSIASCTRSPSIQVSIDEHIFIRFFTTGKYGNWLRNIIPAASGLSYQVDSYCALLTQLAEILTVFAADADCG